MLPENATFLPPAARPFAFSLQPVGSRVTCNPAPTNTDCDYLVLTRDEHLGHFAQELQNAGWALGGSQPTDETEVQDDEQFWSYTKGEDNVIITKNLTFYRRFLAATSVAKRLNLLDKTDRIALFQATLYGVSCQPREARALLSFTETKA